MATSWKLEIEGDPDQGDLDHIAECVRDGFFAGPLVQSDIEPYGEVSSTDIAR